MAKVNIDEFSRVTAQFCGCERIFTDEELADAVWLGPFPIPRTLLDFDDDIPF
jgi:hypothetical protein